MKFLPFGKATSSSNTTLIKAALAFDCGCSLQPPCCLPSVHRAPTKVSIAAYWGNRLLPPLRLYGQNTQNGSTLARLHPWCLLSSLIHAVTSVISLLCVCVRDYTRMCLHMHVHVLVYMYLCVHVCAHARRLPPVSFMPQVLCTLF